MKFSKKTEITLEFDKVKNMLAAVASTSGAKELALSLEPTDNIDFVHRAQKRTTDAKRLADTKGMPSFGSIVDMSSICERADKGAVLSTRELLDAANLLRTSRSLKDYIRSNKLFDTVLDEIFERMLPNKHLEDSILRAIISEDMVADEASPALGDVRRKIRATNNRIKEVLQKYTGGAHAKYLQENIVTLRDGRYVVPVRSECKNEVKGIVHDTSSSGATVFIEPMAVVEANNELRTLEAKEQHEIEKILFTFSSEVSTIGQSLRLNYANITELAFVFAWAELASRMKAVMPTVSGDRVMRLMRARHPLIDKDKVVPVNILIDGYDTVIITGPNTGGKTVTLKTLGLFALMAQAGLHIPAEDGSSVCVFDHVLVDIGDEQSIEQSLSTFSSHMVNIVDMLRDVNDRSLVLFDELGVGTDPVEGAALAVAIIEHVREKGALCAATTHYAELKAYALETEGVRNASCEFDVETLRPTYKLIIGTPGKSNAFAISEKLGLSRTIIERAQTYVSSDNKRFENVIEQLEATRIQMERERDEAMELRQSYERFKSESERTLKQRLKDSEDALEKARVKAQSMVDSAKISSEYIFDQLEKARRAKESERLGEELDSARKAIRAHLRDNESKFNPVEERKNKAYVLPRKLKKGDKVLLVDIGKEGYLLEDPDSSGNVRVQAGIIKTKTKLSNLQLIEDEIVFKSAKEKSVSSVRSAASATFRDEIDLRGMTGDEAYFAVDKYLDDAIMSSITTVRLIHGKGTGALKVALWNYLRSDKRIASFRIGQYGEGDGGVTIVTLK
jgi:DNA mismatch repair protein MutS2